VTTAELRPTLERVTDAIAEIDRDCRTILNGIEHGLLNVEAEFKERPLEAKGLTTEPLIAWLVRQKLASADRKICFEMKYPGSGEECDLVFDVGARGQLWLELKLAWKAWFTCRSGPIYSNKSYGNYLRSARRSHSFRRDFGKHKNAGIPAGDHLAVCLIGFDWVQKPMDTDVAAVVETARHEDGPWMPATERHWPDRRCLDFRINVWSWVLSPQVMPAIGLNGR